MIYLLFDLLRYINQFLPGVYYILNLKNIFYINKSVDYIAKKNKKKLF